ncbi:acyl-CoA dehydrogenase family protein [Alcanivorax sp. S71-1-4]|uniref:acyl-CoA dehydrogenase family protein n=1 Tax=Alcanivorax sp. S71-1-4 TaxID=1177159 RepID=UPI0013597E0F|nr:acyl-CoA dehydrogenase family protein [Alcanivorax sp. S71-1-4]
MQSDLSWATGLHEVLVHLLQAPTSPRPMPDLAAWRPAWHALTAHSGSPLLLALRGGYDADRLGWAFSAGYQAALRALLPSIGADEIVAFGATESGGNRPRHIATACTALPDGRVQLNGEKSWITLGSGCTRLLIVAREAESDPERPQLAVWQVPVATAGVSLPASTPLPFIPEVPHTRCRLDNVVLPAAARLPGDGYDGYLKPFRTIEDLYVNLALLACTLREARARQWPQALRARLLATVSGLAALTTQPPSSPVTHAALDGLLAEAAGVHQQAAEQLAGEADALAEYWRRDAPLFGVAGKARALRAQRAWETLG